jgi:hypothetical protein
MRFFVKLDNGNKIKAFSAADAAKLARKVGGKVITVPVTR